MWVRARLCKLQKGCTRLATAIDKAYQLLAHGRWFSPGIPASSTTKTGRHDIVEILLKVPLNNKYQSINRSINQSNNLIEIFSIIVCRFCSLSFGHCIYVFLSRFTVSGYLCGICKLF
jgi:hypothetical protein